MATAQTRPDSITLSYSLHELPTAQHKAGLSGLLLQIDSLNERRQAGALPAELEVPAILERKATSASIRFTERSMWNLFDDLYDAEVVEQYRKQKQPKKEPKRVEEVEARDPATGKRKKEKRYVYDVIQPIGSFLRRFADDDKDVWHKLWRDMLLAIPRNQDATLGPFKDMAQLRLARGGQPEWERMEITRRKTDSVCHLVCREGASQWDDLCRFERGRRVGVLATTSLSGALLLGVQEKTADLLTCEDQINHALLLHFWPLAARIYVPESINSNGEREFVGYVVTIPEVNDLIRFNRAFIRLLQELRPQKSGYRPADAIVTLPAQGSLEFMQQLAELAERKAIEEGPSRYLAAVEFFHMVKVGNNVKTLAHSRVPPRDYLLRQYAGVRSNYRNPLFQSAYLTAILRSEPWFAEFANPLIEREWSFFLHSTQEKHRTPPAMIGFAREANRRFQQLEENYRILKETHMPTTNTRADSVDRLIYRVVGRYVHFRTLSRLRVDEDDPRKPWMQEVKGKNGELIKRETPEYQEERRKVCSSLFLELRSRNAEDFVEHFSNVLPSVAQYLPEDEYAVIAAALMRTYADDTCENRLRTRDDVKTLTLLALSAHSRSLSPQKDTEVDALGTEETEI